MVSVGLEVSAVHQTLFNPDRCARRYPAIQAVGCKVPRSS